MSKGRVCSICTHTDRGQIDGLLAASVRLKDIAAQIPGLSPYALSRHKRNCLATATASPTGDNASLEAQISVWLQRSEDLYHAGAINLDLRSQAQALTSALRCLEVTRKNQERAQAEEEKEVATGPDAVLTIAAMDRIIAQADADPRRRPIEEVRWELQSAPEKVFPALVPAVLTFIREFRTPEPPTAAPEPAPTPAPQPAPEPEEISFLQCPDCSARGVVASNGHLQCTQCGRQEELQGGIRLRPTFPTNWMQKELAQA
jgi:hypothetical protein